MEGYVVTENGEKVLPGSRRPDGTIRKERRIRAGYVPQDEQPVYQSQGVMVSMMRCCSPGLPQQAADTTCCSSSSSTAAEATLLQQQHLTDYGEFAGNRPGVCRQQRRLWFGLIYSVLWPAGKAQCPKVSRP